METPKVYQAIAAVAEEMAGEGVAKKNKNASQGYSFRGIDDMYNALAPVMARNKLIVTPRMLARNQEERVNKSGTALFYVTVEAEFDLISAEDGSKHTIKTFGEAMDSGDKATNKAMSAAYKYAVMQTFCIPTEGDNDADATTHQVVSKSAPKSLPQERPTAIKEAQEGMGLTPKYVTFVDEDGQTSQVDVLDLPEFDETELRWQLERLLDRAQDATIIDLAKATESKATLKTAKKVSIIAGIRKYAALLEQNLEKATPKEPTVNGKDTDTPNLKAMMHHGATRNSD